MGEAERGTLDAVTTRWFKILSLGDPSLTAMFPKRYSTARPVVLSMPHDQ
jgi:hypothetical protein